MALIAVIIGSGFLTVHAAKDYRQFAGCVAHESTERATVIGKYKTGSGRTERRHIQLVFPSGQNSILVDHSVFNRTEEGQELQISLERGMLQLVAEDGCLRLPQEVVGRILFGLTAAIIGFCALMWLLVSGRMDATGFFWRDNAPSNPPP